MKLLIFPLIFLVTLAFLSQMGIATTTWSSTNDIGLNPYEDGYFDADGHQVCFENLTAAGEAGSLVFRTSGSPTIPFWKNASGEYIAYQTSTGEAVDSLSFDLASSLGLIAIIAAGIILAGVIGLRVLGSGVSEESVSAIWKGTLLLTVWGIFSVLSMALITGIPLLGPFFYMFLTIIYCLGIINQVGHPGED